ncbi:MAG: hypothetical protein K0S77_2997 [Pseudomonas sp.]|nr:hypothetical protein [Pseudomonas sp.]
MHTNNTRWLTLALLAPMLLASACSTPPTSSPPSSVAPARIPPLSPEARQPPALPWCSPTCSHGLMRERENWRGRMTRLE